MRTQDNISQSEEGCCKWEALVDTENSLCTQVNLCIDTTFFVMVKGMWSTQRLLCVDIGFSVSACFMGSFSVEKVTFKTRMCYIYIQILYYES